MTSTALPVSIRLQASEVDQLKARAYAVSGTVTGVTRELVRTGLAGGDNKALAERLMLIERRIVALEQQAREMHTKVLSIDQAARDLLAMFDALLKALTGESTERTA
jgi:predicted phage-related endonuclease